MKIPFPTGGLHRGLAAEEQPQGTSFDLLNVRPFDTVAERIRGGKRPAVIKAYDTQVSGGSHPVLYLVSITSTYIEPV